MKLHDLANVELRQLLSCVLHIDQNKMCGLSQSVHHHLYGINATNYSAMT